MGNRSHLISPRSPAALARRALTNVTADGASQGDLLGVDISREGRVTAQYSNGLTRDIYQIALATFNNPNGLAEGENSSFLTNTQAGDVALSVPGTGRTGFVEGAALELSTVDIGQEFSTLIQTQRAYAANTRVLSAADELWRTLTQTAR